MLQYQLNNLLRSYNFGKNVLTLKELSTKTEEDFIENDKEFIEEFNKALSKYFKDIKIKYLDIMMKSNGARHQSQNIPKLIVI